MHQSNIRVQLRKAIEEYHCALKMVRGVKCYVRIHDIFKFVHISNHKQTPRDSIVVCKVSQRGTKLWV